MANNPKVNHQNLLAAHQRQTRMVMQDCGGTVLVIHDTTEADYSGLSIDGLGPPGNGGCRGLLLHHVLAVDYGQRQVLGLVGQLVHVCRQAPRGETKAVSRRHPQRESRLWVGGVEAAGVVPAGQRWVNLMDRGGDSYESLACQQQRGRFYVLRSKANRRIEVQDAGGRRRKAKLHSWARKLPTLGQRTLSVAAQDQQPAREAQVRVAAGAVRLLAPRQARGEYLERPLEVWGVPVREVGAPHGVEALEWVLLTNVPTATKAQAWERVDWYECRPIVEEYHKAQKTGCGMELPQFTTRKALEVTIALVSVVAVQLLRLRDLARRPDAADRRADGVIDGEYIEVLSRWRFRQARCDLSVQEFLAALARLGGYLGRRQDRLPGWLILWRGWMELQRLVEGARLMQPERSG